MKRRYCRPLFCSLLVAVLPASVVVLSPTLAVAQDTLLPLKIKVGEKAPDFALPSAAGTTVRLSDYPGHKVLIDFYRGYW